MASRPGSRRRLPRGLLPGLAVTASVLLAGASAGSARLLPVNGHHSSPHAAAPRLPVAVDPGQSAARIEVRTFHSSALGRDMPYTVFLPPGYASRDMRYSVLYMLHGLSGTNSEWQSYGIFEAATRMMLSGEIPPFLVVLPQGDDSYWVDHANGGPPWGRYLAGDVVSEVDSRYRTIPDRGNRAIGGLSMGADGALQLSLNYPEEFGVVGAHSPVLRPYEIAASFYGDRGYFEAHYPVTLAARRPDVARTLVISVDVGDSDQWRANAEAFHRELSDLQIPHAWQVWPGGHSGTYWTAHVPDYLRFYGSSLGPPGPVQRVRTEPV